jgi:hypothetical protein
VQVGKEKQKKREREIEEKGAFPAVPSPLN